MADPKNSPAKQAYLDARRRLNQAQIHLCEYLAHEDGERMLSQLSAHLNGLAAAMEQEALRIDSQRYRP
jgi:hypothetical protein